MPTTQTTVQFDDSQIQSQKYWYEKVPYTYLESSLPTTNPNTIFNVNSVATASQNKQIAILSDIAVTQVSGVNLQTQHGVSAVSNPTVGYPAPNNGVVYGGQDEGVRSVGRLGLSLINSTGAAQSNVQCNYSVAVKNLSTADKILRGITLNSDDQKYAAKFNLQGEGKRPLPVSRIIDQYVMGQVLDEITYTQNISSVTSSLQVVENLFPNSGEMFILKDLAAEATFGNLVYLSLSRDYQKNYCQVLADNENANVSNIDRPFKCWIPALNNLSISIQAITTTPNVPVRFTVLRVKLTPYLRVLFGLENPLSLKGELATFYEQVQAGVWS